jgi:hypothetical protein
MIKILITIYTKHLVRMSTKILISKQGKILSIIKQNHSMPQPKDFNHLANKWKNKAKNARSKFNNKFIIHKKIFCRVILL